MKKVKEERHIEFGQIRTIKIYTVRIDPCVSTVWYHSKVGEKFDCILVVKESTTPIPRPAFAIVQKVGDRYRPPSIIRTIRPEDCTVVNEVNELYSSLRGFRGSFE